jgi:adenylate cyclase
MEFKRALQAGASEERLARLMQARAIPGADRTAIDQRIWDLFGERWAVMFTDLSGFSRNVAEFGIVHWLQVLYSAEQLLLPIIELHDGILLKVEGDSYLVIFRNPAKAVTASVHMQRRLLSYNHERAAEEKVLLCVGLGFGDVLRIGDADVFGAQVNAASKLGEDTAGPTEILITDAMREVALGVDGVTVATPISAVPPGAKSAFKLEYT